MIKKPKIFFFNQVTGYLFLDIINVFAKDYDCTLFTGQIIENNTPLDVSVKKKFLIKYNRGTAAGRIASWGMFTIQSFFRLLFVSSKGTELFIATNPPFNPFTGYFIYKLRRIKYHLLVYDVYPDALLNFGMIKCNGIVNNLWGKLNRHVYKQASTIFTLSNNMAALITNYCPGIKVEVIANWADTSFIKPVNKKENSFAKQYEQTDKLTVMYSGNMGATHAVEKIAELAKAFISDSRLGFMLIGEGAKKKNLQNLKEAWALDNLIILPYQDKEILPSSLACADIGIVTLSSGAEDLSVPSKTYNLLAAGVALLVIASPHSELAKLVDQYCCGRHFTEDETGQMTSFLNEIKLFPDRLQLMKENARQAAAYFTPANAGLYKTLLHSNSYIQNV